MEPSNLITWAVCLGVAWLIFAGLTGADDWLKSFFGQSKKTELEERVERLEKQVEEAGRK